jgi:hypothetical protein
MHAPNLGFQPKFVIFALALIPVTLWMVMHGYHGIREDGQIYAFQAYARLHPHLTTDLYLQNTSQDQFTLFSPVYAWFISLLGLENAARLLTLTFTVWLLAAVWGLARAVAGRDAAWLGVASLLIIEGDYGGSGVFRLVDSFLTARLPAEALIVSALLCHVRGMKRLGLLLTLSAFLIHPLMALPGLLTMLCLWLPLRVGVAGTIGGVLATLAIAILAINAPAFSHVLMVMDDSWVDVVRERSQFLFLQFWSIRDWAVNARPFIFLAFTAFAVTDERIRKLCAAAALVGCAGLAVAMIGSLIGPVAILVQGQAWRWVWIAALVSATLLPALAFKVWGDDRCGAPCTLLLVLGWTLPAGIGAICASVALIFWLCRTHFSSRLAARLRLACAGLGLALVVWILLTSWPGETPATVASGHPQLSALQLPELPGFRFTIALLGALVWWGIRIRRTKWLPAVITTLLTTISLLTFPEAFKQARTLANGDIQEFADWQARIPPTSAVLVVPAQDAGAFVWFTLGRPNYLVMNQSAGVVFSRATALEVRRRSEVLLPLMDSDWKIMTRLRAQSGNRRANDPPVRPLTAKTLAQVCADPRLGFVVSQRQVGFNPLRHEQAGAWKGWSLYDCRNIREAQSAI